MKPLHHIRGIAFQMILAMLYLSVQAQGLHITPGAHLVISDSPNLVLNNSSLINNGSFEAGNSTVLFTGNNASANSFIGGRTPISFYNITIGRSLGNVQLNNNTSVNGTITMDSGNLKLNNYLLDLGSSGNIAKESSNSCITGATGGAIRITTVLHAPQGVNPGNIGVELTSDADLGTTVITRGHVQQTNSGGESGIQRYFDISPAVNTSLKATLRFFYLDGELAGNNKEDLALFSNTGDGGRWGSLGRDQTNTNAGWVVKGNINQLSRITLARAGNKEGNAAGSKIFVHAYPNPFHDAFTIQLFTDRERDGVIYFHDTRGHLLETKRVHYLAGLNTVEWTISPYAEGTYFVVFDDPALETIAIVKL